MNDQITISRQEYKRLTDLAKTAADLSEYFIPILDFDVNVMNERGVEALCDFEYALRKYKELTEPAD